MSRVSRVACLLLGLSMISCDLLRQAGQGTLVECEVNDDASPETRCANLVPSKWDLRKFKDKDAEALLQFIGGLKPQAQVDSQFRVVNPNCRTTDIEDRKFRVTMTVPEAITQYPKSGSKGRDLVSAVFLAAQDEGCAEARYTHKALKKPDNDKWEVAAQFTTIVTDPSTGAGPTKVKIGTWYAYAILRRPKSDSSLEYMLSKEVRTGPLMLCQKDVGHVGQVAYISCEQYGAMRTAVERRLIRNISTVDEAIREYKAGNPDVHAATGTNFEVSESPGWMRCGDLGCCAMDNRT